MPPIDCVANPISSFGASLVFLVIPLITNFFSPIATAVGVVLIIIRYWGQFDSRSAKHNNTAKSYRDIRDRLIVLIGDYMSGAVSDSEMIERRDVIKKDIDSTDAHALSTTNRDYRKAQKNLRNEVVKGEHATLSNKEIDRWLPEDLKITDR